MILNKHWNYRFYILILSVFGLLPSLFSQGNTAALSGIISDESGAVVPSVEVIVESESTAAHRTTHTDSTGKYTFVQLPPGNYKLSAKLEGFQTGVANGIDLTIGRETTLDIRLKVGEIKSETEVTAVADLVDTKSTALSQVMENEAIRELPLNGRDFAQLALLQPGVAPLVRSADSGGPGVKITIEGNRPNQNSFLLDGSDINDGYNNTPGSAAGVLLGIDTLQEFRVLTNAFSAEYGRASGGVISAVTKSGTNKLHGSLFEFLRNSNLDAKNFFDSKVASIPPFKRNQFGVEVDGPIFKDRTFFLGSYEGLRQRLGVTTVSIVPDANARQGILPGRAPVSVDPSIPGYLALLPLPNGRNFGDGTGQFITSASQPTNENFFTGRIDHHLSDFTSGFARYVYDTASSKQPDGFNIQSATAGSLNRYLTIGITHAFNERLLDTFRFSYNRSYNSTGTSFLKKIDPSLSFIPGAPLGQLSVTGSFQIGPSRFGPSVSSMSLYQFSDDLSWTKGRHSIKVGGDYRFYYQPTIRPQSPYGFYSFTSLANFLTATPLNVELALPSSILYRHWYQSMTDFYVQDDFQISRRVTLNLGVRYEREGIPSEADGLSANIRDPERDKTATVGPMYVNPTNRGFAPRVGVAWDPFGDGKTSVRAGFGMHYSPFWTDIYSNISGKMIPFYVLGSISNPVFPNAYALVGSARFVIGPQNSMEYRPNYPYVLQDNVTIQRQITQGSSLTVSYAGERGIHIPQQIDFNQKPQTILPDGRIFFPATGSLQNPNFGQIRHYGFNNISTYHALHLTFEQRFGHGLLARVNYSYSRNIDSGSILITSGGSNDLGQNPINLKAERGLSNYDLRNYFVTYLVWDVPTFHGPKLLTSGWQLNAVTTVSSGQPFSVNVGVDRARSGVGSLTSSRPDLCPGADNNPILGEPSRYYSPSAFCIQEPGFYGNLGRNTLIGPGLLMLNPSISKQIQLTEGLRMQFRAEMFNALNHPNFLIPGARTIFNSSGPVGSAGLITATTTSSRQLQLGLKLSF